MTKVDIILIAVLSVVTILGFVLGFRRQSKILSNGIFGLIINGFASYKIYTMICNTTLIKNAMDFIINYLSGFDNKGLNLLLKVHIEKIVVIVLIYLLVVLVKFLLSLLVSSIVAKDNDKGAFNHVLGGVLSFITIFIVITSICNVLFNIGVIDNSMLSAFGRFILSINI